MRSVEHSSINQLYPDRKTSETSPSQPDMAHLLLSFQNTIKQQQIAIEFLLKQQKEQQQKIEFLSQFQQAVNINLPHKDQMGQETLSHEIVKTEPQINLLSNAVSSVNNLKLESTEDDTKVVVKEEDNKPVPEIAKSEPTIETTVSNREFPQQYGPYSPELKEKIEFDENPCSRKEHPFKIIRRNEFKDQVPEEIHDDIVKTRKRKSKKQIIPNYSSAKAKYIWMNFGRKIVAFALTETTNEGHEKIKEFLGCLNSKRDFKQIFGIRPRDTEWDKAFKVMFGKLALFFIYFKAEEAFDGSRYKVEMIAKKDVVASMIRRLIGCE